MSEQQGMAIRGRVKELRGEHPDICWRPSPDWSHVCVLDLGHHGPCGWDKPTQPSNVP